jgi:hypothetical protein
MMDEQVKRLVEEIINRLAQRLGADGTRGELVVVFSGATVGMADAMTQLRGLIFDGYKVVTAFSENARDLLGSWVEDQLLGLPHVSAMAPSNWYSAFMDASAVVVPLLSLNTAAKASYLIGDTLPTNLMLHSLAQGKPLFAASNGAHPEERHWRQKSGVAPAFRQSALDRLKTLEDFGCRLTDVKNLRMVINRALTGPVSYRGDSHGLLSRTPEHQELINPGQRVVTAAHIRQARDRGVGFHLSPGVIVTPLARELAMSVGVKLMQSK